jgi:hypothetical protein
MINLVVDNANRVFALETDEAITDLTEFGQLTCATEDGKIYVAQHDGGEVSGVVQILNVLPHASFAEVEHEQVILEAPETLEAYIDELSEEGDEDEDEDDEDDPNADDGAVVVGS